MGSQSLRFGTVYKGLICVLLSGVSLVSLAQLTGTLKTKFEKLQDTVQDDARFELEGKRVKITYQIPEASNGNIVIVQIVRVSALNRSRELVPVSVKRQTFSVEWASVKSIQLDKKAAKITFKKEIKTSISELDTLSGKEAKSEKSEKELYIFFPKTSQARDAMKLLTSLHSGLTK